MSDLNPILEIDNELILFRQIFLIRNKTRTSLLIGQGGRITQHLVEYLAYRDGSFNDNIHEYTFGNFLNQCDFIPQNIRKFILICYEHRKRVISTSKYAKEFEKIQLEFLEAFYRVLIWFRYIYQQEFYYGIDFNELDETINFLKDRINKIKDGDYDEGFERYFEEHPQEYFESAFGGFTDILYRIEDAVHDGFDGVGRRFDNVDALLYEIRDQIKECIIIIQDYQKDVQRQLENAVTAEEINKIMLKFTNDCVEKIQKYTENYTSTELYKNEERKLSISFGKSWDKLSDESKTFLTTAKFTYTRMESSEDIIDYSGVCLLVTKALELELYIRFFRDFIKYSREEYKKNYFQYHNSLLQQNKDNGDYYVRDEPKFCDLGTITCILGFNRWGDLKDEGIYDHCMLKSIEYCREHIFKQKRFSDKKIEEKLLEYGGYVDKIRTDYRNPAAHTNELKKVNAKECFEFVLDGEEVLKKMLCNFDY